MTAEEKKNIISRMRIILRNLEYLNNAEKEVDDMYKNKGEGLREYPYKYGAITAIVHAHSFTAMNVAEELNNYITNL